MTSTNGSALTDVLDTAKSVEFLFDPEYVSDECKQICGAKLEVRSQLYLIMADFLPNSLEAGPIKKARPPQLSIKRIMPWFTGPMNKDFRQAEKRLQNLKCTSRVEESTSGNDQSPKSGKAKGKNKKTSV